MKPVNERIKEFIEYHIHGDGECNTVVLTEWANNHKLGLQQRYELSYFFSITYSVESAVILFENQAEIFKNINAWVCENKAKLVFQSDRKYIRMKNSFNRCLDYFRNIRDVHEFIGNVTKNGVIVLQKAIPYVETWKLFGRFSAFLFLEMFVDMTGYPIENTTIDWKNGNTATSGLLNVFGYDKEAEDFDKTRRLRRTYKTMDGMLGILVNGIQKNGGNPNVTQVETSLCAYRKFYKGSRYNGYYLDRMLEEIYKMKTDFPKVSEELLEIRARKYEDKYLGEKNGWSGIRPRMKKLYKESGIIT